jgi:DNA repair protein RadC
MRELHSLNEIEIRYRRKPIQQEVRRIQNSSDAIALLRLLYDKNRIHYQEESIAIFLNRNNDVLGFQKLSSGGLTGTIVDARILFSIALKTLSSGIILSHNHPSGNLKPSSQDVSLTHRLKKFGNMIDVCLLDHIIVDDTFNYYSFAEEGTL